MQKISNVKQYIRFRQWSRKGYAVFSCLGKSVTIGCVNKDITEASFRKQKCVNGLPVNESANRNENEFEPDSGNLSGLVEKMLTLLDQPHYAVGESCGVVNLLKTIT